MKALLMTSMFTLSVTILKTNSPLIIMVLITGFTILTAMFIKLINYTSWLGMILFLVFVGGLMILFSCITSLASNEPVNLMNHIDKTIFNAYLFLLMPVIATMLCLLTELLPFSLRSSSSNNLSTLIFKIYSLIPPLSLLMIMLYLLLTMLIMATLTLENAAPYEVLNIKPNNTSMKIY